MLIIIISLSYNACTYRGKKSHPPPETYTSEVTHIYGRDDRIPINHYNTALAKSIGAILVNGLITGTGSLVGDRLVLTSKHILTSTPTAVSNLKNITFIPFSNFNDSSHSQNSVSIIDIKSGGYNGSDRALDWAVLSLNRHPTDSKGQSLPSLPISNQSLKKGLKISLASMTAIRSFNTATLKIHPNCNITLAKIYDQNRNIWPGMFYHNCDAGKGSSGGPMLVKCQNNRYCIVAIQVSAVVSRRDGITSPETHFQKYYPAFSNLAISYKNWSRAINR